MPLPSHYAAFPSRRSLPNHEFLVVKANQGGSHHVTTADQIEARRTFLQPKKTSSVKLQPLGDRVVVERDASESKTAGGIVLPDNAKDKPARGTVVSVGEGRLLEDGKRHPVQVKPGERVLFSSYAGEPFKIGDQELLLMREDDIFAVIE